jgi:hypothetical protein
MVKKIITYNLFTFIFSFIHIIISTIIFEIDFTFIFKIYTYLLPINSLFFFICNKYKHIHVTYILCNIITLFFSIFIFFYLIIDCYSVINSLLLWKALIHFMFSYFVILFFRVIFLLN